MANYSKGTAMTNTILSAARTLFYEKGYSATYCKDIAAHAHANVGLIHYYYGSKGNIALQIYSELLLQTLAITNAHFPQEDLLVQSAIAICIFWSLLEKDNHFCRFMCEIIPERIPLKIADTVMGTDYMRALNREAAQRRSTEEIQLICKCSSAMEMELIQRYAQPDRRFNAQQMAALDNRMTLQISSIPEQRIEEILLRAGQCAKTIYVEMSDTFELHGRDI